MLTPEDRKRIKEEERYQADVRARMARGGTARKMLLTPIYCVGGYLALAWVNALAGTNRTVSNRIEVPAIIQLPASRASQWAAHPRCSDMFGYGAKAQSFCDGITGTKRILMPQR
jgi:hypothetical protein